MDRNQADVVTARAPDGEALDENIVASLQSGYAQRGAAMVPRQGRALPWRVLHSPESDHVMLMKDPVEDPALEFRGTSLSGTLRPATASRRPPP